MQPEGGRQILANVAKRITSSLPLGEARRRRYLAGVAMWRRDPFNRADSGVRLARLHDRTAARASFGAKSWQDKCRAPVHSGPEPPSKISLICQFLVVHGLLLSPLHERGPILRAGKITVM